MLYSKKSLSLLIIFSIIVASLGCNQTAMAAKKVKLSKSKITITVGKKKSLKLNNVSKKKRSKIKWTISNKKIATVKVEKKNKASIKILAKKAGKATVTAKVNKKKYKCKIIVKAKKKTTTSKKTGVNPTPTPKIIYVEVTPSPQKSEAASPSKTPSSVAEGNLTYQSDVTAEMTKASYWADLCKNPDQVLITQDAIAKTNQRIIDQEGTNMNDILNMSETFNATNVKNNLAKALIDEVKVGRVKYGTEDEKKIYLDGVLVDDKDTFFQDMKENIENADTQTEEKVKYGLCTKAAELRMAPLSGFIGWSATDTDDEFVDSRLNINEPLVIKATTADGKYYWGATTNCSGWISSDCVAICENKEEWESMWTKTGDDILVVTEDCITLAPSAYDQSISKLELNFATVLPLVAKEDIPSEIDARGSWYNYVVYVPTRDENGKFLPAMALISMNKKVSIGYLPFTTRNVLETAFSCLGNRYGWGGMLGLMDCSLYTRDIYKCFGFEIPRNTSWQRLMPVGNINLENLSDEEKKKAIDSCLPGTLLMFPGHITMYIGSVNGKQYVISDLGSVSETEEVESEVNVKKKFCVSINSLDVRRSNKKTWLENMVWAGSPWLENK